RDAHGNVSPPPLRGLRSEEVPQAKVHLPAEDRQRDGKEEGRDVRLGRTQNHAPPKESSFPSSTRGSHERLWLAVLAVSPGRVSRTRLLERPDNPLRILRPNACG